MHHKVGHYSFVGGLLICVIAGLLQAQNIFFSLGILVLGIVVGFLNITAKEVTPFLVATVALILAGSADFQMLNIIFNPLGTVMTSIFAFIKLFVAPAILVVSLKSIIKLARTD